MIEWLIACGRDLGDLNKKGELKDGDYTALEIARKMSRTEVVSLLERLSTDPVQTRHELRVKLGVPDALAAELFALTVFLCDNLLQLKSASTTSTLASTSNQLLLLHTSFALLLNCPWSCKWLCAIVLLAQ